jgi:hypothetical protein
MAKNTKNTKTEAELEAVADQMEALNLESPPDDEYVNRLYDIIGDLSFLDLQPLIDVCSRRAEEASRRAEALRALEEAYRGRRRPRRRPRGRNG